MTFEGAGVALWLTLKIAFCATVLNLVFGVWAGFWLARKHFSGKQLVDAFLTLPMVMPPTVLGYYLIVVIGNQGLLGSLWYQKTGFSLMFTWQGAVIAAMLVSFPLVLKSARSAFEAVDPALETAARVLGLSESGIFFRITLPLAWRGILAGLLLSFARAAGEFGATLMVAGTIPGKTETLSIAIYEAVQAGQENVAAFLVALSSLTCLLVLWAVGRLMAGPAPRREM